MIIKRLNPLAALFLFSFILFPASAQARGNSSEQEKVSGSDGQEAASVKVKNDRSGEEDRQGAAWFDRAYSLHTDLRYSQEKR